MGKDQEIVLNAINILNSSTKPKKRKQKKKEKLLTIHNLREFLCGRQWVINAFESGMFPVS